MITDPFFYLLAIPAVTVLGLGKGGFIGIGMIATPLLALAVPPLQGAAILLPILMCQDMISIWTYRHKWSAWNLKVLMSGSLFGIGAATLFASSVSNAAIEVTIGAIGLAFRVLHLARPAAPHRAAAGCRQTAPAAGRARHVVGRTVGLHVAI